MKWFYLKTLTTLKTKPKIHNDAKILASMWILRFCKRPSLTIWTATISKLRKLITPKHAKAKKFVTQWNANENKRPPQKKQ